MDKKRDSEPIPPEARQEKKRESSSVTGERKALHDSLVGTGLDNRSALEMIASYDSAKSRNPDIAKEVGWIMEEYDLTPEEVGQDSTDMTTILYLGMKQSRSEVGQKMIADVLDQKLQKHLADSAIRGMTRLQEGIARSKTLEEVSENLRGVMTKIEALSRTSPVDDKNYAETWKRVDLAFRGLILLRDAGKSAEVSKVFESTFDEFRDVIEDDLLTHRLQEKQSKGEPAYVETVMRELYGLTKEDYEARKRENRSAVATTIMEMKDSRVTRKSIEQLHEVNNKGIVPKKFSKIRSGDSDQGVTFGKRLGLVAEDTEKEIDLLVERMNWLDERSKGNDVSDMEYAIGAARAHNDLLDIHPFADRNGSTALLTLELMMAKRGYEPSKERNGKFYDQLREILNDNPVAIAVVGSEMAKIKYVPGYFAGSEIPESRKKAYDGIVTLLQNQAKTRKDIISDMRMRAAKEKLARLGRMVGINSEDKGAKTA